MRENILKTTEKNYTIEDLHERKAELEALEEKEKKITTELAQEIDRD